MFDAKAVVQSEAKAMRPMEQRQTAKHKQVNPNQRHPHERHQVLVRGRLYPSQRNGQAEEEQLHGNQQRGNNSAGAEEYPEERLIGLVLRHSLPLNSSHRNTSHETM